VNQIRISLTLFCLAAAAVSHAGVITYGDMDCLGQGCYGANNPTLGATQIGLAPNAVTLASTGFVHGFPFSPGGGDFPGTDQIYVGSVQSGAHDGYSGEPQRVNGPDVMVLDYSSQVGAGQSVATLTLGIAADDFQFPVIGQPFSVLVNGVSDPALVAALEGLNQSGPVVQYLTIGLNPLIDNASHILTVSIDEGGDGGDGWAVDFLTVGITTNAATPEPATFGLIALGLAGAALLRRR
jgi:PEP-CTERM motif